MFELTVIYLSTGTLGKDLATSRGVRVTSGLVSLAGGTNPCARGQGHLGVRVTLGLVSWAAVRGWA